MAVAAANDARIEFGKDIYCPACSYNLHKAPGNRCPECGYSLKGLRATESRIPWVHRRSRGRFRSFWQTVWLVTFRNRRFCEEYARDVSYRDARTFQWVCVLHVWLAAIATTGLVYLVTPLPPEPMNPFKQMLATGIWPQGPTQVRRSIEEVWPIAIQHLCLLLFLATATGAPSYFFHPRAISIQRQNSAVALSYYLCAPLACLALGPLLVALVHVALQGDGASVVTQAAYSTGAAVLIVALLWWFNLVRTSRRIMPHVKSRTWAVVFGTPCLWLATAGLTLFLLPYAVIAILVVIDSFR